MLHTKHPLTLKDLDFPLEPPKKATRHWQGIPHRELIRSLLRQTKGWKRKGLTIHLSKDRFEMAATLTLYPTPDRPVQIGVLNSNSMQSQLTFYSGSVVGKQGLSLDKHLAGKHRIGINLDWQCANAITEVVAEVGFSDYHQIVEEFKQTKLTLEEIQTALTKAGRKGLMPWSRLGRIDRLLFGNLRISKLDVLLAFAEVAKMNPPLKQMPQVYRFIHECL